MKGAVSADVEVAVPADEVWATYGTSELSKLIPKLLPNMVEKATTKGDGGLGSIVMATFAPGVPGPKFFKEKFVKLDEINRVKETEQIEGGYLDLGFLSHKLRFEIIDKGDDSSTIRSTIEYEIEEGSAASPSIVTVDALVALAEAIGKHLVEGRAKV